MKVLELEYSSQPHSVWVEGHIQEGSPEEEAAIGAVRLYYKEIWRNEGLSRFRITRKMWASLREGDGVTEYEMFPEPFPEGIPYTEFFSVDALEIRQVSLERQRILEEEIRRFIIKWYPEATEVQPYGEPVRGAQFSLPFIPGTLTWSPYDPDILNLCGVQASLDLLVQRVRPPIPEILCFKLRGGDSSQNFVGSPSL
jgi:hypothetical protein